MIRTILSNSHFVSTSTSSSDFGEKIEVVLGSQITESIPLFLTSEEELQAKSHPTSSIKYHVKL